MTRDSFCHTRSVGATLYHLLLGNRFGDLPEPVAQILTGHERVARGTCEIRRGAGLLSRLLGWALGLPPAGTALPARLLIRPEGDGEIWQRHMGDETLITRQRPHRDGGLEERFGPLELALTLELDGDVLHFRVRRAALCLLGFRLALPRALAPKLCARTWARDGRVQVAVTVAFPIAGLLLGYECDVAMETP